LVAEHGGNAGRGVLDIACETQMKRPSLFRKKREQCLPDLVGVLQGTSVVGKKSMVQSIAQLFRYLVFASLGYGAVSTGDATYCLVTMHCCLERVSVGRREVSDDIGIRYPVRVFG
jgi:hypothetical protein